MAGEAARDPRARYDGGFDRWNRVSRSGWLIPRPYSDGVVYALGNQETVWTWDETGRIWNRLPTDQEHVVLRAHELTMRRLRRGALVIRLLQSQIPAEKRAARSALERIGIAVIDDWRAEENARSADTDFSWFDHPAAVYLAVAHDCRFHHRERDRAMFDADLFAELVADAQQDFKEGRRPKPPRLRAGDLTRLQSPRSAPHAAPQAAAPQATDADNQAPPPANIDPDLDDFPAERPIPGAQPQPESEQMVDLRKAVNDTFAREVRQEARRKTCRRVGTSVGIIIFALLLVGFLARVL